MKHISVAEVHANSLRTLGLDASALDLTSVEALGAAVRRAASFNCPCSAASLVRAVVGPLRGLVDDLGALETRAKETVDAAVAYGDLLEQRDVSAEPGDSAPIWLYAAAPSFVPRVNRAAFILGIAAEQGSGLPPDLDARIQYSGHTRRIATVEGEDLRARLLALGLVELSSEAWLRSPPQELSGVLLARINRALDDAQQSFDVPGLSLLDPERSVRYYPGRWIEPAKRSGRFIARRPQAYGARLWCYAELRDGYAQRIVDLPLAGSRWRGCDEAWHVQMAIDATRSQPQQVRVRTGPGDTVLLDYFSPIPMWGKRRLEAVGEAVQSAGCLFSYRIPTADHTEELQFARKMMWLTDVAENEKRAEV